MDKDLKKTQIARIAESIKNADKVLVGIGNEFDVEKKENENLNSLDGSIQFRNRIYDKNENIETDIAYRHLKKILEGKDYYIISMSMDDAIYRVFDEKDKIVAPCGNFRYLQCNHGCNAMLKEFRDIEPQCKEHQDTIQFVCEKCGQPLVFNNLNATSYVEEGYLNKFAEYKIWLQSTINKKLCILELGVGMKYPSVIRLPFDKMAYYNQKCEFYRVHETLFQHTAENHDRGVSIKENSLEFMGNDAWE